MSVKKGDRDESDLEVVHNLHVLSAKVNELIFNQFGFSKEKYDKKIERFAEWQRKLEVDEETIAERVEKYRQKCEYFNNGFIERETRIVHDLLRQIEIDFTMGNSIFPIQANGDEVKEYVSLQECIARRDFMDKAIADCFALKAEIHYIIRTLPVNINKFENYSKVIETEIRLIKGVRRADNRFLKGQTLNVANATNFANVNSNGNANNNNASSVLGVRPDFETLDKVSDGNSKGKFVRAMQNDSPKGEGQP